MPRPTKCRRVCRFPQILEFAPAQGGSEKTPVILTVDEYETIRLIDKEGLSQEQCSRQMQIARTTVQKIYETARKKVADVLVDGLPLRIEGGEYRLCDGGNPFCGRQQGCQRQPCQRFQTPKGEDIMRIAVTYEDGQIFQHFGHSKQFKLYDINGQQILSSKVVDVVGGGHGALAAFLRSLQVDTLICGGIGGGAQQALAEAGIRLDGGVSGDPDAAVKALLEGSLAYNPDIQCSHHDASHSHEGGCGHHEGSCGGHHEGCSGHHGSCEH